MFADPAWGTDYATWGLLFVTLAAVIVGGIAALSASRTYELESQTVIIVRQLEREERVENVDPARLLPSFTVAPKPTLAEGIELREPLPNDAHDANASLPGRYTTLEIQNLGRSPRARRLYTVHA
jgi:hypothetical protein